MRLCIGAAHSGHAAIVPMLLRSSLAQHVSTLRLSTGHEEAVSLDTLRQLHPLRNLTALAIDLPVELAERCKSGATDAAEAMVQQLREALPPHLHSFTLHSSRVAPAAANSLTLAALASLPHLSEINVPRDAQGLELAPLLKMTSLRALHLGGAVPSQEQCAVLTQLTSLRRLRARWDGTSLWCLLSGKHRLHLLERLADLDCIALDEPDIMTGMLSLPALQSLTPACVAPNSWGELGSLKRLTNLRVDTGSATRLLPSNCKHSALRSGRCVSCSASSCTCSRCDWGKKKKKTKQRRRQEKAAKRRRRRPPRSSRACSTRWPPRGWGSRAACCANSVWVG